MTHEAGTTRRRQRPRRPASLVAAVVTLLLTTAACGGRADQATDNPALVSQPTTTTVSTAAPTTTGTTTTPSTAASPTPATAPTTTAPTTTAPTPTDATTTVALPVPEAPPDEQAVEAAAQLGSIEVPRLGLDLPFFEGISLPTLDRGPGHWPGSALPGQIGNVVIAGHRVSHSRPFRHLDELVEGDEVVFTDGGQRSTYVVTGTEIVTPETLRIVDQTPEPTATLFACHPPGSTQYRWVTHLRLKV